ncbi:MAG: sigma-70 family RNA polymerase sigma factor [Acidobacteriota bacterium]
MTDEVTEQLHRWSAGDRQALDDLLPTVYSELSRIAAAYLRKERREHTLQTSALVHEAYLKLVDQGRVQWRNRAHFFAIAAQVMRRLLVDHARNRGCGKRGGGAILLSLQEALIVGQETDPAVLVLDAALSELGEVDAELAEVIELRFFGGLENKEIAEIQQVSDRTVIRRWRTAQAWLFRYLQAERASA